MGTNTMVFLIVMVSVLAGVYSKRLKYRHREEDESSDASTGRVAELEAEVEDLRDRIEALETIVTNESFSLEQEFEALKRRA